MADKYPKFPPVRGIAAYPHLIKPDTKFNPDGDYRTKLRVPAEKSDALIEAMNTAREEFLADMEPKDRKKIKRNHDLFEAETDDEGTETGFNVFSFKTRATFKSKKTGDIVQKNIRFFDSFNQPVKPKDMWSGSDIVIAGTIGVSVVQGVCYVSLRPEGVQIVRLVTGGGASADSYGFETVEGGFAASKADDADSDDDTKSGDGEDPEEF